MTKKEKEAALQIRDARVAALNALGHSGAPETHRRGLLKNLSRWGLVYEKTATKLLGIREMLFRRLVLPEEWIANPAFLSAPKVPVYDPRTLLEIKRELDKDPKLAATGRRSVIDARAAVDAEVKEGYQEFISQARDWRALRAERRALRSEFDSPSTRTRGIRTGEATTMVMPTTGSLLRATTRRTGLQGSPYQRATIVASRPHEKRLYVFDPQKVERGLRGHVETQNALAEFLKKHHIEPYSPGSDDPDYDIAWTTNTAAFVGEVKSITDENEERQLRLGLGQLFRYRQALTIEERPIAAVLIPEHQPADSSWLELCSSLGVIIDWPPVFERLRSAMTLSDEDEL